MKTTVIQGKYEITIERFPFVMRADFDGKVTYCNVKEEHPIYAKLLKALQKHLSK